MNEEKVGRTMEVDEKSVSGTRFCLLLSPDRMRGSLCLRLERFRPRLGSLPGRRQRVCAQRRSPRARRETSPARWRLKRMSPSPAVVVLALLLAQHPSADTLRVPLDYTSIQEAIVAADDGDTVLVWPGTYNERVDFLGKAVAVVGREGAQVTVIDGGGSGPVVTFGSAEPPGARLEGFTVMNGNYNVQLRGGGILCSAGATPVLIHNIVSDNVANYSGGGIACLGSSPFIIANTIVRNRARPFGAIGDGLGGGIACDGGAPTIVANVIEENIAGGTGLSGGGGIACYGGSHPRIDNNAIRHNVAWSTYGLAWGGGVFCTDASHPNITGNSLLENHVQSQTVEEGGAIYCFDSSSPLIRENAIRGHTSGSGGAVHTSNGSEPTLVLNNIEGNDPYGLVNDEPGVTLCAVNNWWGAVSGPYHPETNPGGDGDPVSDGVAFAPWLASAERLVFVRGWPEACRVRQGGDLRVELAVFNRMPGFQRFWFVTSVDLPGGASFGPLAGPTPLMLLPDGMMSGILGHAIPPDAPTGLWTYHASIGIPPHDTLDHAQFDFEVTAAVQRLLRSRSLDCLFPSP